MKIKNILKDKYRYSAFTLSEVLIALVIIGVIAAMTVPIMIAHYQKEETVSKVKKVYSTLNQTTYKAIADYGPVTDWEMQNGQTRDTAKFFADRYLIPYLNILKICENNTDKECKFDKDCLNGEVCRFSDTNDSKSYRFYLADGTYINVSAAVNLNSTGHRKRAAIFFDINGNKGPNKVGRDIFALEYFIETLKYPDDNGNIVPAYVNKSRSDLLSNKSDMCNKKQNGYACLAVIYKDGWDIKSDYPW